MSKHSAYGLPIKEGFVRIVINIDDIVVRVNNYAPDFVNPTSDRPTIKFGIEDSSISSLDDKGYLLAVDSSKGIDSTTFELQKDTIWFDVEMEEVGKVLNNPIYFAISGINPSYINYYIELLHYRIEWLQYDKTSEKISTVSETKREFTQPRPQLEQKFMINDISKCSNMLGRAIKKIDLRTRSAYVRFNTEDGKLDPVLSVIAEELGYHLDILDDETIAKLANKGLKASHLISLKMNY